MCIWHNSTYELDTFAPSLLHPLALIELPIHCLAAYVIIFKTPKTMGSVKKSMLALHLCGAYLDLCLSSLSTQFLLLPAVAGYCVGLYTNLQIPVKWQEYMFIAAISLTGVTILGFFECRFNAIVRGNSAGIYADKKRLLYIGGHVVFAFTFILPITLNPPDQEFGRAYVKNLLPCIPESILNHPDLYVFATDSTLLAVLVAIAVIGFPTQCIVFAVRVAVFLSGTRAVSKQTHKLQKQFFIALCIQVSIPLMFVTVPVTYITCALSKGYFNQALNNITINIISLHGFLTSIVMMIAHKPYRQAVIHMFCGRCSRGEALKTNDNSLVMSVGATVFSNGFK